MKKILLVLTLINLGLSSQALSAYSISDNELSTLLGLTNGAVNIGVDYARMSDDTGFGGYFLLQTEKKPVITQIMSFGGLMKFNIVQKSKFTASMAPGLGIHIFKDIGTSDETTVGFVFKTAAQYKVTSEFALGLESTIITNMFSDKAPSQAQVFSVAGTFAF